MAPLPVSRIADQNILPRLKVFLWPPLLSLRKINRFGGEYLPQSQ
jgi:hypothetical protein